MKNNLIPFLIFIIPLVVLQSCSKKRGCNDEDACNFDSSAEKYDGSCTYPVIWYSDPDKDGFGDPNTSLIQCNQPTGYVDNANGAIGIPAPDFTALDCDGISHNLYAELNAKKIIVIIWVMPCSSCVTEPLNASSIVQSYSTNYPGRVVFYMVDDYANTNCVGMQGWASFYGITNCTMFSDAAINMADYGVPGMPKTVVIGGFNHQVYFNKNESTVGLGAAIDQALIDNP